MDKRDIKVEFSPSGIRIECGNVTPDEMILAAHYIERTADQLLDAQTAAAAHTAPPALAIARAMPTTPNGA